jgi:hypothetical protein
MLDYITAKQTLHTRVIDFSLQEYLFVLQTVLDEDIRVAYASVFDADEFKRNVPSDNEEEYLDGFKVDAELLLDHQNCQQLKQYLEKEYKAEVQSAASNLKDFKFTSSDVQKLLNNLLHDRAESLSEASVRDIVSLIKSMYDSGALDSGDNFQSHFITIPSKFNVMCPNCNREGSAVEGLSFVCEHCGHVAKWDESSKRYWPNLTKL